MPLFGPVLDGLRRHVVRAWRRRALAAEASLEDCRDLVVEVSMGVTHSPSCSEETPCMRCVAEAAAARIVVLEARLADKHLNGSHTGPDDCPIWYEIGPGDGCNCTVAALKSNIERAELAEARVDRARNALRAQRSPSPVGPHALAAKVWEALK